MSRYGPAVLAVVFIIFGETAQAYVGPGAGLSLLGALWGLLAALVAAVAFVLLWPIRRRRRRRAEAARAAPEASDEPENDRRVPQRTGREAH